MVRCLSSSIHTFKNISSETTGRIEVRFYMEHVCLAGTKVYIIGPGHMIKMASMLIYGKNPLKIFFSKFMSDETAHSKRDEP